MRRGEPTVDWRGKVNPLFVLGIRCLRLIPRLFMELAPGGPDTKRQARTVLVEACKESMLLLPPHLARDGDPEEKFTDFPAAGDENEWLSDPEVREAIIDISARVRSVPQELLKKGLDKPHWWM